MLFYYIKETFNSLFRSKLGSLLIIVTITISIIFSSFAVGLIVFSKVINKKLKDRITINLFVQDSVSTYNYKKIEEDLTNNLYVESFKLISKKEALKIMEKKAGKDFLSVLNSNPLPSSYRVKLKADSVNTETIESIVNSLEKTYGIEEVVYDYNITLKVLNYINSSKNIIYIISGFLSLLSIYLVFSNNKLMLSSRENQYKTMKLVGAKLSTIKFPIFLNGILLGLVSSLISLVIFYFSYSFLTQFYNFEIFYIRLEYFVLFIVGLGIFLGFVGSYLATLNISLKINTKV